MDTQQFLELGKRIGCINIEGSRIFYPHVNKSYKAEPEEYVRAAAYTYLVSQLEYPVHRIDLEVTPLRRDPQNPADIVIYSDDKLNACFAVCEIKADSSPSDIEVAKRQGLGNANLQGAQYLFCVCGTEEITYRVASQPSLRNLEEYRIAQLPISYGEAPTYRFIKGENPDFDLRLLNLHELTNKFERAHKALWEGGKRDPVTAFDEMSKIMFAKIHDELKTPPGMSYKCQIGTEEGISVVANRIHQIYTEARHAQPTMFLDDIAVTDDILAEVVGIIQDVSLYNTDLDAKGRAFEQFIGKYFRGEYGQYFTPRNVVSAIVDIADLFLPFSSDSLIIDPACGSGGFLLQVLTKVRERLTKIHPKNDKAFYRLQWDFSRNKIYGIEKNEKIARIAMMDMVIHDDGSSNIKCHDALDSYSSIDSTQHIAPGVFDFVITNPPFGDSVDSGSNYYNDYILGGAGQIARGPSQQIEILFIERCLDLLRDSGILAIVLPDSAINNIENIPIGDFILSNSIYLGALSLPQHTFNPFGSDAKTTVIFLKKNLSSVDSFHRKVEFIERYTSILQKHNPPAEQKARIEKIRSEYRDIDYPILLVHIGKVGFTSVGRPDDDLLPNAIQTFKEFIQNSDKCTSTYIDSDFWVSKINFLDLISKLDVEAYNPAYFDVLSQIESLPEGEIRRLSELCLTPAVQSGTGSSKYIESGIPIVKTADVVKRRRTSKNTKASAARIGFIQWQEITDFCSEDTFNNQGSKQLHIGDILVQCVAHKPDYIGDKITLVDTLPPDGEALALNKFLIIRPDPSLIEPEYVLQYLASPFGRLQMARFNRGMTAQIYEQDVRDFIIYLPPPSVSQKVSSRYKEVVQRIRNLESRYESLLNLLDDFEFLP